MCIRDSYSSDAEIYERAGLMDHGPSIFAHVIFPTEEDKRILKKHGSFSVHCPDATVNIIAGIMPLQHMEAEGLKIAMGTDIAGGHGIGIYRQVARAVQLSKLKEFYEPQESKTITITQAFYHATKESGSVFGKVGSFEKGYAFNALVIDNMEDPWTKMTAEEKLERFCYIGDDRNIKACLLYTSHIGLTAHSTAVFERALNLDWVETIMFPYNIVENQGDELIRKCQEKNEMCIRDRR